MNLNAQSLLLPNAQWPFTYPYKSYDFAIHPAFLQTACRVLPSPQYPVALEQSQTTTPKVDKFSIDAILKKDSDSEREVKDTCVTNSYDSANVVNDEMELACRRYQRLYEIGHPYLSPQHQTAGSDKTYLQKHLPALKHFSDRSRAADKAEKKASQLPETWSKQTKGKRVRTIFTPEQLERMEAEFERQQYMVGTERYYLASALNLTEAQVKVWFQNRRIKWRKQHLEQQQAKLKSLNMYKDIDSGSESDGEDTLNHSDDINLQSHAAAISDPFQSPKEERGTQ